MRKAYINWERVTEDNIPISGQEYMVSEIMGDVAALRFATWYNKGDIVEIECKPEKDLNEMSAEERLLFWIFGSHKKYEVPVAGFYLKTKDFGVDENVENGAFANCTEMLVALSDDIFFAEEPLVPEGYLTVEQDEKRRKVETEERIRKAKEEKIDSILSEKENDKRIEYAIGAIIGDLNITDTETIIYDCGFGDCELTTLEVADYVILGHHVSDAIVNIYAKEGGCEAIKEKLFKPLIENDACTQKQILDVINDILAKVEISDIRIRKYVAAYLRHIVCYCNFYYYRNDYTRRNKHENNSYNLIEAYIVNKLMSRLGRLCRLKELDAPEPIQSNECKLVGQMLMLHRNITKIVIREEDFAQTFGVYSNGHVYDDGKAHIGNLESDSACPNCEDALDQYFVMGAPNHVYKDGNFALWNPKKGKYYRKNGVDISVFETYQNARNYQEELNGENN